VKERQREREKSERDHLPLLFVHDHLTIEGVLGSSLRDQEKREKWIKKRKKVEFMICNRDGNKKTQTEKNSK
jgi:hypothetical protein